MTLLVDERARREAAQWLRLADAGDATGTWHASAAAFQGAVSAERWAEQLAAARVPLGQLTSRVDAVAQLVEALPGAPRGQYVVLQYHSVFNAEKAVVETVTLLREASGAWKVVGYFIR